MPGPISNTEAQRLLGTRLEIYRLAVQAGFYNEGPATVAYKGFHIVPDGETCIVMQNGMRLIATSNVKAAKQWITSRLTRGSEN
jgi:hypothetical protein